jgi:hypothetical protein
MQSLIDKMSSVNFSNFRKFIIDGATKMTTEPTGQNTAIADILAIFFQNMKATIVGATAAIAVIARLH